MTGAPRRSGFAALRGRADTEHEMSFDRLAFALVIPVYLYTEGAPPLAQILPGLYWLVAIGLFAHILRWPAINKPRRVIALCLDMGFLCAELHVGDKITSALAPIYLWVILGNGFRFGVAWLRGAAAVAIVGFVAVWATTPFWSTQPHLSAGFLLGLIAIPAYAGTLIRKLNAAKDQAEQASQAKSIFLASVSHGLRTPLTAIIGMGDLLKRSRLDREQREMARTVTEAGRELLGLIDGILDFSRIEAGRVSVRAEPIGLAALLAETRRMLAPQAQEKGVQLLFHVSPRTPPWLSADPRLLRDVVLNLAGEAEWAVEARSVSVLVVDDSGVNRRVVQRILESGGHCATLVTNGEEALDALEEARLDLVLMDVNMPVVDVIEAARLYQLQSLGRRRVPILALTADATPQARQRCLDAGIEACLTKPVTPQVLLHAVRTHALTDGAPPPAAQVTEILAHVRFRPSGPPTIDEAALAGLEALGGKDFVESVVGEFLADAELLLAELSAAAASRDFAAFRAKAHSLRSAAVNIGARAFCDLCRVAQDAESADIAAAGAQIVAKLTEELDRPRQALRQRAARSSSAQIS